MKLELKPEILEVAKRQGDIATNAGMSRDGQISWVFNAGFLEVTVTNTNEILATWRFGKVLSDVNTTIICVTDLTFGGEYLLLVATSCLTNQGTLNIFSVGLRKVIRTIEIPQRVTALDVIFTNVAEDVPDWILSKHLQFFSGLVAVGTEAGYIYLVDLCLDELTVSHSTEANPKKLSVISPSIVDPKPKREQAKLYDRHLAMLLDDQCHRQGNFYYRRQDDTIQKVLDEDTVAVTSIKYVSQAGTLAVGFNFGSFQLWRLYNPVLDYSSRFSPDNVAISHFVVQEPENDPRNFVYLWVGHDDSSGDSVSSVCLYQLCFARKNIYPSFGMYYDELESVCARLDHKLTHDPYSSDTKSTRSSSIINCYTIVNPYFTPPSKLSDSFEEGLHSNDFSLGMFVWRAEGKRAGSSSKYWMCIFDLNRWYHAQMPHTLRCHGNSLQVCSYWVAYSLDEVVSLASCSVSLLGVGISGDKVLRFINNTPLPPEEHSYPSALQLTSVQIVTSESCLRARCDGWQGQLLHQLAQNGAQILVQPADFYHQCHRARLLPQNYEELKISSTEYQRTVLLNMALEHGITSTLVPQCIQQWADGEFAEEGCCLSFLLRWAWDRVVSIKQTWDTTCEMLYDWSGHYLDSRTDWHLESLTESLSNLKQIFSALIAQSSPVTKKGEEEMELRQDVVNILLLQYNVVRWCVSFNLLPEIDEGSEPHLGLFRYPISILIDTYTKKRAELSSKKGIIKDFSLLLIDDFLDCHGPHIKKMWKTLGGNGLYPPPSVQAVVNMYLIEEVSTEVKHAITLYLLQDLAALAKSEAGEAVIASFIQRFMLSPGLVHQIQGLWFIDHRDFEEGVRHLVNPNIHEDLGGAWKHVAVVNTLLAQSEGKAATRYLHTKGVLGGSPQEQQLYISVLLNNRQVSQALEYMRGLQHEKNSANLLDHLIDECRKNKLLGHLLQLSLTDQEEVHLEQYLRGHAEHHALEPLLLYYLHHSRFLQAYQLNEDMKKMDRLETNLVAQERAATRNCLMEAYLRALPDVTRKLLMEKQRGSVSTAKRFEVQRPKPLSTRVHKADHVAMSRSHFVMAVLEKVTEAQNIVAGGAPDLNEDDDNTRETDRSRSTVPFLGTPRTPKHKMYSRVSEIIYSEVKQSPLATNPLSTAKRRTMLEAKDGQLNGNISLRQLTEECLQLLQTPIRNHKNKLSSPGLMSTISQIKTPQSILKVQRLSKTVMSSSKDNPNVRRSSGRRSTKLGFSPGSSLHASPTKSPPVEKMDSSTPHLVSAGNTAIKHLRFVGLSPSPTPSPTIAPEFLSLDKSQEIVEMEDMSSSWQQIVRPDKELHASRELLSEKASIADTLRINEHVPCDSAKETLPKSCGSGTPIKDVLFIEDQSFSEGPSERYSSEFEDLVRPDLQSQWKQEQLTGGHNEGSPLNKSETSSHISSVNVISASRPSKEDAMEGGGQSLRSRESHSTTDTHFVEQMVSSHSSITSISQKVVKTTTKYVELSVDPDVSTSYVQDASSPMIRSSLRRNLSPLLVSSSHNLRSQKSSSISPKSLETNVGASILSTEAYPRSESPPLTPPSSKRAKILESRTKEMESLKKNIRVVPSPGSSKVDETRERKTPVQRSPNLKPEHEELRRKTPERKSPSRKLQELDEDMVDEELKRKTPERKLPLRKFHELHEEKVNEEVKRKTPERKSPSRKLQKLDDDKVDEELKMKTHERKSPSRKLLELDEDKFEEESKRKTPERQSPSRKLLELDEDKFEEESKRKTPEIQTPLRKLQKLDEVDEESKRKTPERQSPSRKLQKLDEGRVDEELKRKTPERQSPSRKLQKLDEGRVDEELKRKTPERQSPSRKLQKLDEDRVDEELKRKTPERQTPSRKLQKLDEGKVDEELKRKTPERQSPSRKLQKLDEEVDEELKKKTPERKSPSRKLQKLEEDKSDEDNGKLVFPLKSQRRTPDRQSATRKLLRLSESDDDKQITGELEDTSLLTYKNHPKTSTSRIEEGKDQRMDETFGSGEVYDEQSKAGVHTESQVKRRSTRLNTPDRVLTEGSGLEPLSPARGRGRATRTPQKVAQKQTEVDENMEVEGKSSPSRRSTRKKEIAISATVEDGNSEATTVGHGKNEEQTVDNGRSPEKHSKKQIIEEEENEKDVHSFRRSRRQSKTPDRLIANMDSLEPLTPTRKSMRLPKIPEKIHANETEPLKASLEIPKMGDKERATSKEKELPVKKSLEAPFTSAQEAKSKHSFPDHISAEEESIPMNTSHSRAVKTESSLQDEHQQASSSKTDKIAELQEPAQRSLSRKTPDRQTRGTDSEQAKAEAADSEINRGKSPGRSRKSPVRQTRSPARQTRSPARQTSDDGVEIEKGNNADDNADGWSEEMPALRLDVEDDSGDVELQDVAEMMGRQRETPERLLRHHKKGPSSTTSEDPLVPSSPGQLTVTAGKSNQNKDLTRTKARTFIFSPPVKQSEQAHEHKKHPSANPDDGEVQKPVFLFSPPTVAADSGRARDTETVELESESADTVKEPAKQKSKKKRILLSYSPILLSPRSPVSVRRSHRHLLESQRAAPGSKLRAPRARRIKPSTRIEPSTSR